MAPSSRPHTNDLFALFPDLPWHRPRVPEEQMRDVLRQAAATRQRASRNVARQRAATERVRERLLARRRRR